MNHEELNVESLSAAYGDHISLLNISFRLPVGVRCAILGPNGAGKTTLLKCILGLHEPLLGSVTYGDHSFADMREKIAYIPQRKTVDWNFPITAYDVVLMGTYHLVPFYKRLPSQAHQRADYALKKVNLEKESKKTISELSGGQQQRVFIARALAQGATLYCMDEPFTGVDKKTETSLANLFVELQSEGNTLLVVHHDLNTLYEYFDWVILINKKLFYAGPLSNRTIISKYIESTFSE